MLKILNFIMISIILSSCSTFYSPSSVAAKTWDFIQYPMSTGVLMTEEDGYDTARGCRMVKIFSGYGDYPPLYEVFCPTFDSNIYYGNK